MGTRPGGQCIRGLIPRTPRRTQAMPPEPVITHEGLAVYEVTAPTMILCGRHDPQYPPACSEELTSGIPGSRLSWFERCGHYPFIEEPEAFWTAVGDFLAASPAAPGP